MVGVTGSLQSQTWSQVEVARLFIGYRIRHHKTTSYLIIGYISNKECCLGSNMRDPRETTQVVG